MRRFHPVGTCGAVLALALACVALTACGGGSGAGSAFRLKSLDGQTLGPPDFRGQVVVVDFWATWCGPCHIQADILKSAEETWRERGVKFLAVNVGEPESVVRDFVQQSTPPYPVLLDPNEEVSGDLGVMALPTLLILDKMGKTVFLESGVVDGEELDQLLREAGAG